ncbi:MAG: hypothetical protein R3B97_01795 [Dehalococcoidia bacterium]|nr:hypothetical protein [Dehalococcoidia bacterium]
MYRMKGNRDSAGSSTSIIAVDIDPSELGELDSRRPRSGRRRLVAMLAAIIAVLTASSLVSFALVGPGDDSVSTATAISAATVEPSATTVLAAAPSPSTTATATATAALSVSVTPTVSASAATPTLQPATSATTAPAAPSATPGRRVRYVVQPGDACDLLRARFGFAPARWEDFIQAMATLSGRSEAAACALSPGNVVCIPAPADIDVLPSLRRDDACLAGS